MAKTMHAITVICGIGTVFALIAYRMSSYDVFLTFAITFGTGTYHFLMRLLVGFIFNVLMHNRADYRKRWYSLHKWEERFYRRMNVKRWKNRMPTYRPDWFDPRVHTWDEIVQAMCQAELVHEVIIVLSFVPIAAGIWFGAYPVFIITSLLAAGFDMMFVVMQRYNRERILCGMRRRAEKRKKQNS